MKIILITGTTKGIGKSLAIKLKEAGNYIIGINRSYDKNVDESILCDLSDMDELFSLCNKLREYNIDVLINNAGGGTPCSFVEKSTEQILSETTLNFLAPMIITQSVMQQMLSKEYGRIINISSISGRTATPFLDVYSASKSAINSLTVSLAKLYSKDNFTINSVSPGAVETDTSITGRVILSRLYGLEEYQYQDNMIKNNSLDRLITTEEVSDLILFLISDKAAVISGQNINICGTLEIH